MGDAISQSRQGKQDRPPPRPKIDATRLMLKCLKLDSCVQQTLCSVRF
ncbi:hypothetical protein A2U01_0048982, partial [Trifolium medium]|nr:hypothetical protein [Trifolium medium]